MKYRNLIILGIVAIVAAAYVVYSGYESRKAQLEAQSSLQNAQVVGPVFAPPASKRPDGFLEYKNLLLRFDIFYPDYLAVREYDDGTSASTITFESATGTRGFEIFVVPYGKDFISTEQFKKDAPSGVMNQPLDVIVDGTRATMFYGKNAVMGDTREVWFIKNGYLYEISTYRNLDEWLSKIMETWKFI